MADPTVVQYEDPVLKHMSKFYVRETSKMFTIEVPGTPAIDATGDSPAVDAVPAKLWSFTREVLPLIFSHKRDDEPALFDFVQSAWSFAHHSAGVGKGAIIKPTEEQTKINAVCAKFGGSLLETLDINTYAQFIELSNAVEMLTTAGAVRAAEKKAAKDVKDAERKAKSDAKKAEKKAEKDKAKAEKEALKDKEKADAKAAKDAAKPKKETKTERQAKLAAASKVGTPAEGTPATAAIPAKPAKPLSKKAQAEMDRVNKESEEAKAAKEAEQARIKDEKARMDAEFEAEQNPAPSVADELLSGD